jgi:RecB family exonuclease
MTRTVASRRHVAIDQDGRCLAMADVERGRSAGTAMASLHVESGHLPIGTCTRLVDAVLDTPEVSGAKRFKASVPRDYAEILEQMRRRCDAVSIRAAGASVIVEGLPRQKDRSQQS